MRRRWAIAVAVLGLGGGAAIVLAVTLPGNRGEGRLGVQISELPENAVASVVATGPGGFSTELSQTTTVGDLSPGRYSVSARPVAVDGTTFYPTISGAPASVTTTSSPEVEVAYITKIPDSTKVLEGATLDSLVSVSPTARVLAFSNESIAFAEGDVLVAGVSPETPRGLLRRVVDVDRGSTRTVLRTEQASLDEAVTRGEVSLERPLSFEDVQRADPLVEGVAFAEGSLVVTIEGTAGKALVVSCRPGVEVRARGRIELDPDFDFSASWGFFDGLKVRATVTTDEDAEVSFTASGSARCSKAVELYRLHFAPITVAVGPVPVVVTPVLTVNLDIEGRVDSSLSLSAVQSASLTAGLAYDDGRVSTIKDFNSEFERPRAEVSPVALSATASARPRLDLLLYGIVGPSLQAEGYLRLDVTPLDRPWWELLGGLKASARISLDILSGRIKVNLAQATVIDWRRRIAAAKGPAPFRRFEVRNLRGASRARAPPRTLVSLPGRVA